MKKDMLYFAFFTLLIPLGVFLCTMAVILAEKLAPVIRGIVRRNMQ